MKLPLPWSLFFITLLSTGLQVQSQAKKILLNSPFELFEFTGGPGNCTISPMPGFCPVALGETLFSSALYKDTLYIISANNNNVYRTKLGVPGSCSFVTSFPQTDPSNTHSNINSFTVDQNGILYGVSSHNSDLYIYNPYTNTMKAPGRVPFTPAGDAIFYGDKLLLSTVVNGICEINITDPSASTQYMSTGNFYFFGMISFPDACDKNKIYGLAPGAGGTQLVELDLDNKTVSGVVCTLPITVYDGASIVETGNTIGIRVDSIVIDAPCESNEFTGDVRILGYSATEGDLTYTLNNTDVNTTGNFPGLALGTYQVRITNSIGCTKDTFFTIARGLPPNIQVTTSDPVSCDIQNGSISIQATSFYQPITITVNNGPPQANLTLTDLGAGPYTIVLRDQGNCMSDTSVILKYTDRPAFLGNITTSPTICESKTGSIMVGVNGNASGITAALDNGTPQSVLQFNNLDSGSHQLSLFYSGSCRFDTVVQIEKLYDPAPSITIVKEDQLCFENNGKVTIQATGQGGFFHVSFNNGNFTPVFAFDHLAPEIYPIVIRNSNLCTWDTAIEIVAYPKVPVEFTLDKTDAHCRELNSGRILVNVTGAEGPYSLQLNDGLISSGTWFNSPPGDFIIPILNRDQCPVDSAQVTVGLIIEPECDRVLLPNAFSPNNDGLNDFFQPIHGPYIKNVVLTIYNRWGQVVFRSAAGQPGWDGTLNGRQVDQGMYIWTLSYDNFSGERKKMNGWVMVVY